MTVPSVVECRLVVPVPSVLDDMGRVAALETRLTSLFGGFTRTSGLGGWRDDYSRHIVEDIHVYDVAIPNTRAHADILRDVAAQVRRDFKQRSVYLRGPSGQVEFVDKDPPSPADEFIPGPPGFASAPDMGDFVA